MFFWRKVIFLILVSLFFVPPAFAHEAYVLPKADFSQGINSPSTLLVLKALENKDNLNLFLIISVGITLLLISYLIFLFTPWYQRLDKWLSKFAQFGPLVVRITLAASLFFSVLTDSFLGPELSLEQFPFVFFIKIGLFSASLMFLFGFLTEIASVITLAIFLLGFKVFGTYIFTYANYLGEVLVLSLFGSRFLTVDRYLFGKLDRFKKWQKYESTIVRLFYGFGLAFAAITVKFFHPQLTVEVYNMYHLGQFSLLFPKDPLLATLGAALAEVLIGIFIILAFELRLVVFISLIYITLSLLYFKEAVWPHLLLYGISINLLINRQNFSLDEFLIKHIKLFRR